MSKPNNEKNHQPQKNGKENGTQGRPTKFNEKFIIEGQALARAGLPQKQMAWFWKISEDSITRWKEQHPAFADALKKGEAEKHIALLNAMYENAISKMQPALQIFLAKNWLGMKDQTEFIPSQDFPMKVEIVPASNAGPKKA